MCITCTVRPFIICVTCCGFVNLTVERKQLNRYTLLSSNSLKPTRSWLECIFYLHSTLVWGSAPKENTGRRNIFYTGKKQLFVYTSRVTFCPQLTSWLNYEMILFSASPEKRPLSINIWSSFCTAAWENISFEHAGVWNENYCFTCLGIVRFVIGIIKKSQKISNSSATFW